LKSKKTVDLLGMGIAPVDFFVSMEDHPKCGLKINGISGSSLIAGGGPVPTALCTFSKLGGKASLITSLGDDSWAQFSRDELDRFGVNHNLCIVRQNCQSALAFAWINIKSGDRTIVLDMDQRLFIRPGDIKLISMPEPPPKLIHIDGRHVDANVKLARWGRKVGAKIMLDVGSVRNIVDDLFPFLDYLVCADQYAFNFFRTRSIEKAAAGFRKIGIPEVVVTSGTAGSLGIDASGNQGRQRAYKVRAVDATGAGDVFHGAYLYGIHKGWGLSKKMKFASAAAALKCRKSGARDGIPSLRQTLKFMNNHKVYYA
jgi:sugar/nucleoside kinase (ribokinase family)